MSSSNLKKPQVNHATCTITITETFNRASKIFGTEACDLMKKIRNAFPDYDVVVSSTRRKASKNKTKPTYAMMERYIKHLRNGEEGLKIFEQVKDCAKSYKPAYQKVYEWFNQSFPDYDAALRFDKNGFLVARTNIISFEDFKEKQEAAAQEKQRENEQKATA